jgi:hypothetical protein
LDFCTVKNPSDRCEFNAGYRIYQGGTDILLPDPQQPGPQSSQQQIDPLLPMQRFIIIQSLISARISLYLGKDRHLMILSTLLHGMLFLKKMRKSK